MLSLQKRFRVEIDTPSSTKPKDLDISWAVRTPSCIAKKIPSPVNGSVVWRASPIRYADVYLRLLTRGVIGNAVWISPVISTLRNSSLRVRIGMNSLRNKGFEIGHCKASEASWYNHCDVCFVGGYTDDSSISPIKEKH